MGCYKRLLDSMTFIIGVAEKQILADHMIFKAAIAYYKRAKTACPGLSNPNTQQLAVAHLERENV